MRPLNKRAVAAFALLVLFGVPLGAGIPPVFSLAPPATSEASRAAALGFSLVRPPAAAVAPAAAVDAADEEMPKKTRRAIVQLGLLAVYSTYRYWSAYHEWVEDWQYELTCADQYRRFLTLEAIRFDSNSFVVNWTHVLAGALYYQFGRANYLTWTGSLLASFTSSLIYEYVSEWREVISVNDMFLTTFGGFALGEAWFQLGDFLHHQKAPALKALGFVNPVNKLNQWLDRKKPASHLNASPVWAAIVLSAAWLRSSETGRGTFNVPLVSLDTEILRIPEYGRPGELRKTIRDTSLSELGIEVAVRGHPEGEDQLKTGFAEEVDLFARVVGLARYRQKIDELGRGYALSIGLGSALTYLRKRATVYDSRSVRVIFDPLPETPTDFRDKMAITHLAGPVLDWTRFGRKTRVRLVADAYIDFGLINAFAFNAYSGAYPIEGLKTTLGYYGYHYAYGASASARVDLDWGNLWVRGLASAHAWDSWEGLDRFEADLTNNVGAVDTRTRLLLKAGWTVPSLRVRAFAAVRCIRRWGRIGDVSASSRETRTTIGLSYLF